MATKEIIVDSSVWISYFDEDDSQHQKAEDLLEKLSQPFLIPEYILLEVVTVLRQKNREVELEQFLDSATRDYVYLPAGNLGVMVASCYSDKKYSKLSFVDVALVILAKKYKVITFDKALTQVISKQK